MHRSSTRGLGKNGALAMASGSGAGQCRRVFLAEGVPGTSDAALSAGLGSEEAVKIADSARCPHVVLRAPVPAVGDAPAEFRGFFWESPCTRLHANPALIGDSLRHGQ